MDALSRIFAQVDQIRHEHPQEPTKNEDPPWEEPEKVVMPNITTPLPERPKGRGGS